MAAHPPSVVLVSGDPVLGMNNIVTLKASWKEACLAGIQCVEFTPIGEKNLPKLLNALDGEVSTLDWGEAHKIVLLRGLVGVKGFRDSLCQIISNVAEGNTIVIFDETGVIKADSGWKDFHSLINQRGFVAEVPPPFSALDKAPWGHKVGPKHIKVVVDAMAKRGKKISSKTVEEVFFEMVPLDWCYIKGELEKLADLTSGDHITPDDVRNIVFACTPGHAIYEFSDAFNSGIRDKVIDKYDEMIESGLSHEVVFSFTMKLIRWQMIAGHLLSYGSPLPQSLEAIGSHMTADRAEVKSSKLRSMKPHLFKRGKEREAQIEKIHKEEGVTSFMAKGASRFVKEVLPRIVPIKSKEIGSFPFMYELMRRYMLMVNCIEKVRLEGSDTARKTFRETILKICWREN